MLFISSLWNSSYAEYEFDFSNNLSQLITNFHIYPLPFSAAPHPHTNLGPIQHAPQHLSPHPHQPPLAALNLRRQPKQPQQQSPHARNNLKRTLDNAMPPLPGVGTRERRLDVRVDDECGGEHACDEGGRDAVEQRFRWRRRQVV